MQQLGHGDLSVDVDSSALVGPALWPKSLRVSGGRGSRDVDARPLDPSRMYRLSRSWMIGSCPHLFILTGRGSRAYFCSIFTRGSGETQSERLVIPSGARAVVIAELEDETTTIEALRLTSGYRLTRPVTLAKGEFRVIPAEGGDVLRITGRYDVQRTTRAGVWSRNVVIRRFLSDQVGSDMHALPAVSTNDFATHP